MSKKRFLTLVLIIVLSLTNVASAYAYSKSTSGTRAYIFIDSDYISWPISYDYYTYERWDYYYSVNETHIYNCWNDGTLNNANNIPLDQTMDNQTIFIQKSSSTSTTYTEIARIYSYNWETPSVIYPAQDIYFPGYKPYSYYILTPNLGRIKHYWWLYVTEGWWGAARSYTASNYYNL